MDTYIAGSTGKVPRKAKLVYGWADLYGGGALNLVGFYYLIFLTDVVNINPAWAGLIILLSKGWDAVSDPLMGVLTDRTRTRIGKRRPYFIVNIFSVILALLVLWNPAYFPSETARFLYALFAYLFFSTVSTVLMVPYLSMMPLLARDYNERTSLNGYKMAFSFLGGILAAVLPMQIVNSFADIRHGYLAMALVFGIFFSIPWIFVSLYFREPDSRNDPVPEKFRFREFIEPLKIRSFRYVIGMYLGAFLVLDIMSALIAYFITYVLDRPSDLQIVLGTLIICQLLSMPLVIKISGKIGKNRTTVLSSMVWIVSIAFIAVTPVHWPAYILYIQAAVTGFGVCGSLVMPWTMYPDATDVGFIALGKDCAGSFSGIMTFFRKLASALALFIVGLVLQLSGYLRPVELVTQGARQIMHQTQPGEALLAIRLLLSLAPLLLLSLVSLLALRTPLTRESYGIVRSHVDFLQGKGGKDLSEEELAELKRRLI
jgi:Na+/melibiose symporter-like transporter